MEASVLRCPSCGASVGPDAIRCPYCASELATLACPHCLGHVSIHARFCPRCGKGAQASTAKVAADLDCPDCKTALGMVRAGEVELASCARCGGVWVAREVFDHLAGTREERGAVLGALPGAERKTLNVGAPIRYRTCPECRKHMNRLNYAQVSGVILDVCKEHGLWFDRDELRHVVEFIEGGGLEKSRARQIRTLEEERRLAASAASVPLPTMTGSGDQGFFGTPSPGIDLVAALLRFLR